MYGVCVDVCVAVAKFDVDDDEVVDVFHVVADLWFHQSFLHRGVDEDVAGGAIGDLCAGVRVEVVLTVCPFDFDLMYR